MSKCNPELRAFVGHAWNHSKIGDAHIGHAARKIRHPVSAMLQGNDKRSPKATEAGIRGRIVNVNVRRHVYFGFSMRWQGAAFSLRSIIYKRRRWVECYVVPPCHANDLAYPETR